jgi:peptide deformylase
VGLAAPQVGVNKRLMVYNPEGVKGLGEETVLCNPRVVEASAVEDWFEEGCLSFPRIYADVQVRRRCGGSRAAPACRVRPRKANTTNIR